MSTHVDIETTCDAMVRQEIIWLKEGYERAFKYFDEDCMNAAEDNKADKWQKCDENRTKMLGAIEAMKEALYILDFYEVR